jgi:hypothetical protein
LHVEDVPPLFLPLHRLARWLGNEDWPRQPAVPWAMDSGGFMHVLTNGGWTTAADEFVGQVWSHLLHVGGCRWAAPQDWMCEPAVLAATGLTVADHQVRTIANFAAVCAEWDRLEDAATAWLGDLAEPADRRPCPFIPVLQGWTVDDYRVCADMYLAAGVDLPAYPVVGLGSVCRRQATSTIATIVETLADEYRLPLHGFGVKTGGLDAYGDLLASADSQAWSYAARRRTDYCTHGRVRWERNCPVYARQWWADVVDHLPPHRSRAAHQVSLW